MFLLLLLLVVAVAMAAAGLLGVGALSTERRQQRTGLLAALSAPVVLIGGLAVLAVVVLGVGRGGGDDEGAGAPEPPRTTVPAPTATTLPPARLQNVTTDYRIVRVELAKDPRFALSQPVTGLEPGGVVRVLVSGFGEFEVGVLEQCVTELGRETACGPSFPVQFDMHGRADALFVLRGDIAAGGCRTGQPTCLLQVRAGERVATIQTVMVDRFVPGQVTVSPDRRLDDGQPVDVAVTGFPAGSRATAVLCAPSATYDARRCTPGLATFTVDARGTGRATVSVSPGRVGTDRVLCGPRDSCAVMVLVEPGFVAAAATPVSFSEGPGVAYGGGRVLTGIAVAVALLGLALAIGLRTDWTKPTEAATPEMDRADLRAADTLDDLFGTDAELDAKDPIPW